MDATKACGMKRVTAMVGAVKEAGLDYYNHNLSCANSIFYGDKLLVTANAQVEPDRQLLERQGIVMIKVVR